MPEPVPTRGPALSADPATAFGELLANCVPTLCDACYVDLEVAGSPRQRIDVSPVGPGHDGHACDGAEPQLRSVPRTSVALGRHDVPFAGDATAAAPAYSGVAAFRWWSREPAAADGAVVSLLVELTTRTIAWQRSEQDARAADVRVEQLKVALQTNRRIGAAIGIVMGSRKVTQDRAFELLATASQTRNRKLHQIAEEVLETGWLDPSVAPAG